MYNREIERNIANSKLAMPIAIILSVSFWVLTVILFDGEQRPLIPIWECTLGRYITITPTLSRVLAVAIYIIVAGILILMNNKFSLIRTRTMSQSLTYVILISSSPMLMHIGQGMLASVFLLISVLLLMASYDNSSASLTNLSFFFYGLACIIYPPLLFLYVFFILGQYNFRSLNLRTFLAGVIGFILPYWLLYAHAYFWDEKYLMTNVIEGVWSREDFMSGYTLVSVVTMSFMAVLFICSAINYILSTLNDRIQTRRYLNFMISFQVSFFLYYILQPNSYINILPILLIGESIFLAHLFTLRRNKFVRIVNILAVVGIIGLFALNIWMN